LVNRVIVLSFDWRYLRELHELEPMQVLGALGPPVRLADGARPPRFAKGLSGRWLDKLIRTGAKLAVWNHRVSRRAAQAAADRGLKVWVYTVNTPRHALRLVNIGVQGIITNQVSPIRDANLSP